MGFLVHCVTLPMVFSSKLITHDEMINLVYVPLSVHCTQPYVLLPVSVLTSKSFLLGAQPSLISTAVLQLDRLKKKGLKEFTIVPLRWYISHSAVKHGAITLLVS